MDQASMDSSSSATRGRVAIPRLDREPAPPPKIRDKAKEDRVGRACKNCRKRKVRCSGDEPTCKNCENTSTVCIYEKARRDRLKEASNLNHDLVLLLKDLHLKVDETDKKRIKDILNNAEDDIMAPTTMTPHMTLGKRDRQVSVESESQSPIKNGEAYVTASVGSNEDLDHLDEDLMRNHESRETGYYGQNSEIQWLRSVQRQTEHPGVEPRQRHYGPPGAGQEAIDARLAAREDRRNVARQDSRQGSMKHITDSSFYLDSVNIDVDIVVEYYEVPNPDYAEKLFTCYFETVHPVFPLVTPNFVDQFRRFLSSTRKGGPFLVPDKWRAQLNLVFAIGAKYSHLIGAEWRGHEREHLIYMTRAVHLLALKNTVMVISGPDLDLVQATGALSFYFLTIGHVSRAWVMIGISLRLALALGLHLRNEDPGVEESRKRTLEQTWWTLHSIECLISVITGRPPVISYEDCTVPLPYSVLSEHRATRNGFDPSAVHAKCFPSPRASSQTNRSSSAFGIDNITKHSSFLTGHINNTLISQKALTNLYSPRVASKTWESVQHKIREMLGELEDWAQITSALNTTSPLPEASMMSKREKFLLQIDYWSTKMLITRPCLCRLDGRIKNESNKSHEFNSTTAELCVDAAIQLVNLLPSKPDLEFIYNNGPWWALVHFLMQPMAILLLELAYEGEHTKTEHKALAPAIKKLISWLRAMSENDAVAANAYKIVWKILKSCAPPLQEQATFLLSEDLQPFNQPDTSAYTKSSEGKAFSPQWAYSNDQPGHSFNQDPDFLDQQQAFSSNSPNLFDAYFNQQQSFSQMSPALFGNPFYTNFDQVTPVVNLSDIWNDPFTGNDDMNMNFTFRSDSQIPDDSNIDFTNQGQQQDDSQQ